MLECGTLLAKFRNRRDANVGVRDVVQHRRRRTLSRFAGSRRKEHGRGGVPAAVAAGSGGRWIVRVGCSPSSSRKRIGSGGVAVRTGERRVLAPQRGAGDIIWDSNKDEEAIISGFF